MVIGQGQPGARQGKELLTIKSEIELDLEEGDMLDCTKADWALNKATYAVKTKVPLEQRIVFVHIDVMNVFFAWPAFGPEFNQTAEPNLIVWAENWTEPDFGSTTYNLIAEMPVGTPVLGYTFFWEHPAVFPAPNRLIQMVAGITENADDVAGNILVVKHARGRKNDVMDCNEVDMEWVNHIMIHETSHKCNGKSRYRHTGQFQSPFSARH
ncbi:hypothetical protein DFJ58DRAFT_874728 [Suillus subalutaceus]|uniref:uncharacterized protein n=1 Tax=Suillus subalutaceus TaxID=48586 RepID=UPI001B85DBB1|nr:uncharacterized protein DFJ58DRAFT_874728 [Suillus subalutaceus]KAG1830045.1 hypothetical protein DFJ58DRAFT_874728 [Suillus subalutaceus]